MCKNRHVPPIPLTGLKESQVTRIKDHIFNKEHSLIDRVGRFDPNYDMAQAWKRLSNGTFAKSDIDLLNHELFESRFEGIFKVDYDTAHKATIKSGRIWDPD